MKTWQCNNLKSMVRMLRNSEGDIEYLDYAISDKNIKHVHI